jgi:hypothetical protein
MPTARCVPACYRDWYMDASVTCRPRCGTWLVAVSCLWMAACGGRGKVENPNEPPPLERWETQKEWVFVSPQRCVTGPFEIELPDREIEFGRRFVLEVFGERSLPFDTEMTFTDGTTWRGWGWSEENLSGDHSACRGHDDDVLAEAPEAGAHEGDPDPEGDGDPRTGEGGAGGSAGAGGEIELEAQALPILYRFDGALPARRRQSGGRAWYPQGNPNEYSLDDIGPRYREEGGDLGFRFRFWFHRPVDMEGVVIRFRDQVLVPNEPIERYRAIFAARVAEASKARGKPTSSGSSQSDVARGKVPPPPRHEEVPEVPGPEVDWVPGYWEYHAELDDFVWIGGTFVVRAAAGEPAGDELAADHEIHDDPGPRELDDSVPPQPAPRRETIPPPPAVAGAVWVAGYWQLEGDTWQWVEGRWEVPQRGIRFRAPSIEVRGGVKVYVPGGWSRRR